MYAVLIILIFVWNYCLSQFKDSLKETFHKLAQFPEVLMKCLWRPWWKYQSKKLQNTLNSTQPFSSTRCAIFKTGPTASSKQL